MHNLHRVMTGLHKLTLNNAMFKSDKKFYDAIIKKVASLVYYSSTGSLLMLR